MLMSLFRASQVGYVTPLRDGIEPGGQGVRRRPVAG